MGGSVTGPVTAPPAAPFESRPDRGHPEPDGAGPAKASAVPSPERFAGSDTSADRRQRVILRIWEAGWRFPSNVGSPAVHHWISRGCWPPDRMLPRRAIRWVPRLALPGVADGLPPLSSSAAGVMLYGFVAPEATERVRALRAVPLSGAGTLIADGFRPPNAPPAPRWSLAEGAGLGIGVRAAEEGAVLIAEDVASALALSLIYSEAEVGAVFAAANSDALGTLASAFTPGRPVFVFPDEPSPLRFEAIRHACRSAGRPLPEIRMMPGGKSPAQALSEAIHSQSGGVRTNRATLADAFRRVLSRKSPPLEAGTPAAAQVLPPSPLPAPD